MRLSKYLKSLLIIGAFFSASKVTACSQDVMMEIIRAHPLRDVRVDKEFLQMLKTGVTPLTLEHFENYQLECPTILGQCLSPDKIDAYNVVIPDVFYDITRPHANEFRQVFEELTGCKFTIGGTYQFSLNHVGLYATQLLTCYQQALSTNSPIAANEAFNRLSILLSEFCYLYQSHPDNPAYLVNLEGLVIADFIGACSLSVFHDWLKHKTFSWNERVLQDISHLYLHQSHTFRQIAMLDGTSHPLFLKMRAVVTEKVNETAAELTALIEEGNQEFTKVLGYPIKCYTIEGLKEKLSWVENLACCSLPVINKLKTIDVNEINNCFSTFLEGVNKVTPGAYLTRRNDFLLYSLVCWPKNRQALDDLVHYALKGGIISEEGKAAIITISL